jgi:hypothetical protein
MFWPRFKSIPPLAQAIKIANPPPIATRFMPWEICCWFPAESPKPARFSKSLQNRPPAEVNYASEAIAKVIKAEDGTIGRANEFAAAIRPKE